LKYLKRVELGAWLTHQTLEFYILYLRHGGDDKLGTNYKKRLKQFHLLSPFFYTTLMTCNEVGSASKVFALVKCSYQFEIHGIETEIILSQYARF
jgi:Ulp1 family protease